MGAVTTLLRSAAPPPVSDNFARSPDTTRSAHRPHTAGAAHHPVSRHAAAAPSAAPTTTKSPRLSTETADGRTSHPRCTPDARAGSAPNTPRQANPRSRPRYRGPRTRPTPVAAPGGRRRALPCRHHRAVTRTQRNGPTSRGRNRCQITGLPNVTAGSAIPADPRTPSASTVHRRPFRARDYRPVR